MKRPRTGAIRRSATTRGGRKRRVYADLSRPQGDVLLVVFEPEDGARLDRFLAERLAWKSRTQAQKLVLAGDVSVNGAPARKVSQRVFRRDEVLVRVPRPAEPLRLDEIAIDIVYEDPHILALSKAAGIVCHPVGSKRYNTLVNALHGRYRNLDVPGLDVVPRLCHRLDKDTSGLIIVALAPGVRKRMQWIFESKSVVKEYFAVVEGLWERDYDEVDLPIGRASGSHIRIAQGIDWEEGLPSRTIVCVEERFAPAQGDRGFTLVRCSPVTGRQHQIRVHVAARGHPVLGDNMYGTVEPGWGGFPASAPVIRRHALHAHRIQFPHPITGEELDLRAPLHADMTALLELLRKRSPRGAARADPPA